MRQELEDKIEDESDDEWGIGGVIKELYAAMAENGVERRWKKLAIQKVLELETLLKDLQEGQNISDFEIKKIIRHGEDLLNQLNRY